MNNIHFYDTCALLNYYRDIFNGKEDIYISSITYNELEGIKTSIHKDEETKYNARVLIKAIKKFRKTGKCHLILFKNSFLNDIAEYDLPQTNDTNIIATAYHLNKDNNVVFITEDLVCQEIASSLGIKTFCYEEDLEEDNYTGFKIVNLSELELADFYSNFDCPKNTFNLLENQYIIIKMDNKMVAKYRWANNKYNEISFITFNSKMFGKLTPKDDFQLCAMDTIKNNQMSIIRGKAGSGKSMLSLAYLFQELEKNKIDKIIMFVNPVATKDSCKFGFLPGDLEQKILGSQIGNFLSSKLGGIEYVYQLIDNHQLDFVALADCRGYDTTGMNCAVYLTESQNTNIDQMKLILSRIGENTKVIIEGDNLMQTDLSSYAGKNNGLRKACATFKGEDYFGTVTLQNCYRSRIAKKTEEM